MDPRRLLPSARRAFSAACLALALSGCADVTISDPVAPPPAIPPTETPVTVAVAPTASPRPRRTATPTRAAVRPTRTPRPTITPTPEPITYAVAEGDTLSEIATKFAVGLEDLMAINNLTNAHQLSLGQVLIIPSASDIVGDYAPAMTEDGHILHFIREGETLSGIAAQYEVAREDILFANGFRPDVQLFAGDQIIVPQGEYDAKPTPTTPPLDVADTDAIAAAPTNTPEPTAENAATPTPQATPTPLIHTVTEGEVAGRIANEHNISVDALAAANPGVNMERLSIGQQLVIPTGGAPAVAAPAATPTAVTLEPTATATPIPPVMGTYMVTERETWGSVSRALGVPEETLKAHNPTVSGELTAGMRLNIPVGTPTPIPSPTLPPTATSTPAPAYIEPQPLLPANGSTWVHWNGKAPLTLLWTASGILKNNEYYVVRMRALDSAGDMIWDQSYWTQATSLRLEEEVLAQFKERVTLRWDVTVMRQNSRDSESTRTGEALSNKSHTWEILFSYSAAP